jgi:type VI secretion system protein ImpM
MFAASLVGEFGFFGKIPALGDFVTRSLPRDQVGLVDEWMQQGLHTLRGISEQWLDSYLVAPVWQFVLPAGIWSPAPLCGALMPSVDRVGRYFPLIAFAPIGEDPLMEATVLWRRMSRLALLLPGVLHQQLEAEATLNLLQDPAGNDAEDWRRILSLDSFNPRSDKSIWWSERTQYSALREINHRGKPDTELFLRLFGY